MSIARGGKRRRRIKRITMFDVVVTVLAALVCVVTLYPMYYVFIMSISGTQHVLAMDVYFWPKSITFDNYALLINDATMWRAYGNTLFYTAASTLLMVATSVLGAYPLTVKYLKGRKVVVTFLIITMYFNGGVIPLFLLITKMGMYDTPWSVIMTYAFSVMNTILVRSYYSSLPESLRESAKIDGASHFKILFQIYIPVSVSIIAVIAIYGIVEMWNSWYAAMIYLPSKQWHPLQLYLRRVLVEQSVDLTQVRSEDMDWAIAKMFNAMQLKYTMIIFTTLPVIFTYPFFQRYFIKGVMIGSLKE